MRKPLIDNALPLLRLGANILQKILLPLRINLSRRVAGHRIRFDPGTDIGMHLLVSASFEPHAIARCAQYAREDGIILDVGANIGVHTLQFADLVPRGRVICVEPARATFEYLLRNIAGCTNVVPLNVALSDECGMATFYVAADNAYSGLKDTRRKPIRRVETVACFRADDLLLPLLNGSRVDLVKIDVEGFEHQVVEGMRELISRYRPVIFCEIFGGGSSNLDPQATVDMMIAMRYAAHVLEGDRLRPVGTHDDRFYNYFFVPLADAAG